MCLSMNGKAVILCDGGADVVVGNELEEYELDEVG